MVKLAEEIPRPYLSIFMPESMLPVQLSPGKTETGEQRLLVAILDRAWQDLQLAYVERPAVRERYREVRAWFLSQEEEYPTAFVPLCQYLNINADLFRKYIRDHPDRYPDLLPFKRGARRKVAVLRPTKRVHLRLTCVRRWAHYATCLSSAGAHIRLPYNVVFSRIPNPGETCDVVVQYHWAALRRLIEEDTHEVCSAIDGSRSDAVA